MAAEKLNKLADALDGAGHKQKAARIREAQALANAPEFQEAVDEILKDGLEPKEIVALLLAGFIVS